MLKYCPPSPKLISVASTYAEYGNHTPIYSKHVALRVLGFAHPMSPALPFTSVPTLFPSSSLKTCAVALVNAAATLRSLLHPIKNLPQCSAKSRC